MRPCTATGSCSTAATILPTQPHPRRLDDAAVVERGDLEEAVVGGGLGVATHRVKLVLHLPEWEGAGAEPVCSWDRRQAAANTSGDLLGAECAATHGLASSVFSLLFSAHHALPAMAMAASHHIQVLLVVYIELLLLVAPARAGAPVLRLLGRVLKCGAQVREPRLTERAGGATWHGST